MRPQKSRPVPLTLTVQGSLSTKAWAVSVSLVVAWMMVLPGNAVSGTVHIGAGETKAIGVGRVLPKGP